MVQGGVTFALEECSPSYPYDVPFLKDLSQSTPVVRHIPEKNGRMSVESPSGPAKHHTRQVLDGNPSA